MASSPQHEPTMEEILASIRKIISEDTAEPQPAPEPKAVAAPAPMEAPMEADVLELTQEVHDEPPAPVAPKPAPIAMPAPEPVAAAPLPEHDIVFETIEEPPVTQQAPVSSAHEGLFSDKTRKAMEDSFASIDHDDEPAPAARSSAAAVAPVDGRTVEAVFEKAVREAFDPVVNDWLTTNADAVVERMKPLIREWMDAHFPALLEGAVRAEVERVAKARGVKR